MLSKVDNWHSKAVLETVIMHFNHPKTRRRRNALKMDKKSCPGFKDGDIPFLCVVCGDSASGYHYGVPACEGCKAFFKRSLQATDLNYRCPGSNNCKIDKMSRKCCQACRLRKCNEVGMSKEFLGNKKIKKPSRKSKSKKQKFDDDEDRKIVEPTSTQDAELEKLIKILATLHDQERPMLTTEVTGEDLKPTTSNLLDIVGKQLVAAIDWAKGLPGYETLTLNDQAILLQAGWIEMLLLNWTFYSLSHKNKTQFSANLIVCETLATAFGLETVHTQLSSLITRVQGYGIDEVEFLCLKAIGLLNADSRGLTGSSKVQELVKKFSSALNYHISSHHPDQPQKFAKIILILPQLKCVVNNVIEYFYRVKLSGEAQLSELLVEMLEAKSRL
ncbi:steroid hormone receptor ERR2-like isoform X3 [Rhopilema esculentum]|uniref:steroid hormone receptor ERR2-like isoform X3 n=1 Tax=Rhopilema esculentum TaxID=499914 RepID=UPI0031D7E75B